jgi:toxin ParE1/3/4
VRIATEASVEIATAYLENLEDFLLGFDLASERGTLQGHIRKGLRTVGYRGRMTVAFEVEAKSVTILRVFWGGQNWQNIMKN